MTTALLDTAPLTDEQAQAVVNNPDNWIGAGFYRAVYRSPGSRWVIKVEQYDDKSCNENEYGNYQALQDDSELPNNLHIPATYLLDNGLIVQEYIEGVIPIDCEALSICRCEKPGGRCWVKTACEATEDYHAENVRIRGDEVWVIDLGCEAW